MPDFMKTLEDMRKAETERRKEACRNAIENCFNEFKESCDADFDEKLCEEFLTDEKLCEYAEMEKDGKFCGDAVAVRDVSAKCAKVMKDAAKEKKTRENAKKTYAFDPLAEGIPEESAHHVLGVQGNLWTEQIFEEWHAEMMLYPRAFAIAETGWSPSSGKDFGDFKRRAAAWAAVCRAEGYTVYDFEQNTKN